MIMPLMLRLDSETNDISQDRDTDRSINLEGKKDFITAMELPKL